jgi:hypothetical protein
MGKHYALLGVLPTATAEEIEKAYQTKRREYAPDRYEQGTLEWVRAFAMRKELDLAYNNAIMATFAPIQAFSGPIPKLPTPQDGVARPWLTETPEPQAHRPQPRPTETFVQTHIQPQVQPRPQPVQTPPQPQAQQLQSQQIQPQQMPPLEPSLQARPAETAPSYSRQTSPAWSSSNSIPELEGLVEEVPVSFSDAELLNMNVEELRNSYAPQEGEDEFFTLGIEDRLLRSYVKAYLVFALFDLFMRLSLGGAWVGAMPSFNHYSIILEPMSPQIRPSLAAAIAMSPPSTLMWILSAFTSTAYLFCCSFPMPIVTRFFILGQPPENGATHWMLAFLSIVAALGLYSLTGFLFRFFPPVLAGAGMNLAFIAPPLCVVTMRYEGS